MNSASNQPSSIFHGLKVGINIQTLIGTYSMLLVSLQVYTFYASFANYQIAPHNCPHVGQEQASIIVEATVI